MVAGARTLSGSTPAVPRYDGATRQVTACHCEERSDVAIRNPCGSTKQNAILWANTESVTDLPEVAQTCQVSLRGNGLPHQCAHWFAMTCKRQRRVSRCKDVPPLSLRGAKRRGNPHLLRQHKAKRNTLGEYGKRYGFARSSTNLSGFSAGKRIAAPVCALVRNDMQKTEAWVRLQGRVLQ